MALLIVMNGPFNMLPNSGCWYLAENYYVYIHQEYWFVVFFSGVSFSGFGTRVKMTLQI